MAEVLCIDLWKRVWQLLEQLEEPAQVREAPTKNRETLLVILRHCSFRLYNKTDKMVEEASPWACAW